ncbi:MAG: response regulator [Planctomycetota bacterium]|nr:response regulator [Planctomycetota bacterium]
MPTAKNLGRPIEILLVEDSPTDALLAKEALKHGGFDHQLHHVEDGIRAMRFLHREEPYTDAPRPDVVLLDLNLPGMNGHEVLEQIRADVSLRRLPVMVLTTSEDERDINAAYDRNVNCYVTKPVDLKDFIEVAQSLSRFTLTWVALPTDD